METETAQVESYQTNGNGHLGYYEAASIVRQCTRAIKTLNASISSQGYNREDVTSRMHVIRQRFDRASDRIDEINNTPQEVAGKPYQQIQIYLATFRANFWNLAARAGVLEQTK